MAEQTTDDVRTELEAQIKELKSELRSMREKIRATTEDAFEGAEDLYYGAQQRARRTAQQVRAQAHDVSDVIRENPGTAATVLSSVGLVGFLIGLVVGCMMTGDNSRSSYFGKW